MGRGDGVSPAHWRGLLSAGPRTRQAPDQSRKPQLPSEARGPQNYGFKSYLAVARILPASSYTSRKEIRPSSPAYHPKEQLQEALGLLAAGVGEGF